MANDYIRVEGLKEFQALVADSETMLETELASALLAIGQKVAADVKGRYSPYSAPGAGGVVAKLSGGAIWTGKVMVVQTLAKSRSLTRQRPNFGPLMMSKAFYPALDDNAPEAAAEAAGIVSTLAAKWEAG